MPVTDQLEEGPGAEVALAEMVAGLRTVLQPIVHLQSGTIVGFEALSRFDLEPSQPPDLWFAAAERDGLGVELEIAAAKRALEAVDRLPPNTYLSINLSPHALLDERVLDAVTGLRVRVVVEITEHDRVVDYDALSAAIASLREAGVAIAVDDVGAGFANMSHILRLHPDLIKLDVSLTRSVDTDQSRRALVASLTAFASSIPATIVAEGIETEAEAVTLLDLGIPHGQGYLLGRPMASCRDARLPEGTQAFGSPRSDGPSLPLPTWGLATHVGLLADMARERDQRPYATPRRHRAARRLLVVMMTIAILLAGPVTVFAADGSAPGQFLYPVKIAIEDLRLLAQRDPRGDLDLSLRFAERRIRELPGLAGRPDSPGMRGDVLLRLRRHLVEADRMMALVSAHGGPEVASAGSVAAQQASAIRGLLAQACGSDAAGTEPCEDLADAVSGSDLLAPETPANGERPAGSGSGGRSPGAKEKSRPERDPQGGSDAREERSRSQQDRSDGRGSGRNRASGAQGSERGR